MAHKTFDYEYITSAIQRLAKTHTSAELADHLNVSLSTLKRVARQEGLSLSTGEKSAPPIAERKEHAEDIIKRLAGKVTTDEIAAEANVSPSTVKRIARKLNISLHSDEGLPYTKEEDAFIIEHYNLYSFEDIAQRMNLTLNTSRGKDSVKNRAKDLGLSNKKMIKSKIAEDNKLGSWSVIEDIRLILAEESGYSRTKLASELGRTEEAAKARIQYIKKNPRLYDAAMDYLNKEDPHADDDNNYPS